MACGGSGAYCALAQYEGLATRELRAETEGARSRAEGSLNTGWCPCALAGSTP